MKALPTSFALLMLALPLSAQASSPQLPCATAPVPAFAKPGLPPAIAIFHASDLQQYRWQACTGWSPASQSKLVVALAGSFKFDGSIDPLLARVVQFSSFSKIRYWSTTDKKWRPLAYQASALKSPSANDRRPDFSPSELTKGAVLYYWEDDSRSGQLVTRLTVRERTADYATITTENVTPVRSFLITLFPPGALQTAIVIKRITNGLWGVYLLSRTSDASSMLAGGHDASYGNRDVALYRQIIGERTDQEPPALP